MSELFDIQVNAQKEKTFQGSRKLAQAHENCVMEMKETNKEKKRCARKNVIDGRKPL